MELKKLEWDSKFFGREVFAINLHSEDLLVNNREFNKTLQETGADLVYLFLAERNIDLHEQLIKNGAILYDEKVSYSKEVTPEEIPPSKDIQIYKGGLTDELLELAFLAGHESRFKKDPRLSPYFESLYRLWMINSLNGILADRVFVYRADNEIKGMACCKVIDSNSGNLGLIATNKAYQGKGIAKELLHATNEFYRTSNLKFSTVVTQRSNLNACHFYEKAGFVEYKTEFIYHLWFS